MRDKRPVDELSIQELERILALRKREDRQKTMLRLQRAGRLVESPAIAGSFADFAPADDTLPDHTTRPVASAPDEPLFPPLLDGPIPSFEDELSVLPDVGVSSDNADWRRSINSLLVLVEVGVVAGLIFLGLNLFQAVGRLETETASAAALADQQRRAGIPTIAPTPQVMLDAVVLPSGHIFTASGVPQFNYSEIPASLLPLVQDQLIAPPLRRPPPTDETALQLNIPKLNVDQTIVQGVDWEALRLGIGQLPNGSNPASTDGNVVLAAHNDIYGEYFRYLDKLAPGDQFQIQTRTRIYTYTVTNTDIVTPTDVSVMDKRGTPMVTLISCYPYQVNSHRIVVYAQRNS